MTHEITTRRAIEVCLSRLKLHQGTSSDLVWHLQNEITRTGHNPVDLEIDEARASFARIISECDVGDGSSKRALIGRLDGIRKIAHFALRGASDAA